MYPSASPEIIWAMAESLDPKDPDIPEDQYKEIIKSQCYVDTSIPLRKYTFITYMKTCNVPESAKYLKISGDSGGYSKLADALNMTISVPVCPSILQLFSWAKGWFNEAWISDTEDFIVNLIILRNKGYKIVEVPIDIGTPNQIDVPDLIKTFRNQTLGQKELYESYGEPVTVQEVWEYFRDHI